MLTNPWYDPPNRPSLKVQQMPRSVSISAAIVLALLGSMVSQSEAQAQWGTLSGQIVLDGDVPKLKPVVAKGDASAKDAAVCAAEDLPDEKLVVDAESKGIANVVVYLAKKPSKIHPDLVKSKEAEIKFDQKGCRFLPHVMVVRTDQKVRVLSDDAVAHNTHTNPLKNKVDNFIVSPNDRTGVLMNPLAMAERVPVKVICDIHPHMMAYWAVVDHPYAAVTDAKGNFEIADLPVGTHEFIVWQESAGYLDKKYTVEVKAGANAQKPLKFAADKFLKN